MSNPKFLNVEKRVPYNVRLPKRLIEKLNAYAELSGNTTTNIVTTVLDDFLSDKNVLNDYLEDIGGVTVKIPYVTHQKWCFIANYWNLKNYNSTERLEYDYYDSVAVETYFSELFEIKKIPNNLDIYNGDSYVANENALIVNEFLNVIHSGVEFFIYNITETIFTDVNLSGELDSFIECLYCLYFEVTVNNTVNVYLIDYLTAINLLSASGNEEYKDILIAASTELSDIDNVVLKFRDDFLSADEDLKADNGFENEIKDECKAECDKLVAAIADRYNSNNIILFGSDIFSRLAVKELKDKETGFLDEILDEKLNDMIPAKVDEILDDMEKSTADINK